MCAVPAAPEGISRAEAGDGRRRGTRGEERGVEGVDVASALRCHGWPLLSAALTAMYSCGLYATTSNERPALHSIYGPRPERDGILPACRLTSSSPTRRGWSARATSRGSSS